MTDTELDQYITDLQSARDAKKAGRPIQRLGISRVWDDYTGTIYPLSGYCYRAKPAPAVREWTRDTCPPMPFEVRHKVTGHRLCVVAANHDGVWLGAVTEDSPTYAELLSNFTTHDGGVCGITEESK